MTTDLLFVAARYLLMGAGVSLAVALGAIAISASFGLLLALARLYGWWPLRVAASLFVFFIRGVPLLILLISVYFSLPYFGVDLSALAVAILVIGLYFSSYTSEVYRTGIRSIPVLQWDAGRSLGLRRIAIFRLIIAPQAMRYCAAPLINIFIMAVKGTSLISAIGAWEVVMAGRELSERNFAVLPVYLAVAAIYFIICFTLSRLSRAVEKSAAYA